MRDDIAAVTCYFNPAKSVEREHCYKRFAERLRAQGIELWTIEATVEGQPYVFTGNEQTLHTTIPLNGQLWQKERMLNLAIQQLPSKFSKVAWMDCDVLLTDNDWAAKASSVLDDKMAIQLFDFMLWLGPDDEVRQLPRSGPKRPGTAFLFDNLRNQSHDFSVGSPGFAWAARRELLEQHGLYEHDVTGGGDSVIAAGMFGWLDHNHLVTAGPQFQEHSQAYVHALHQAAKGQVGYLRSELLHMWHGSYAERNYRVRHTALADEAYDPQKHVCIDSESQLLEWSKEAHDSLRRCVASFIGIKQTS